MAQEQADASNFSKWQEEASEAILALRDHEAALRVLDTAFQTALSAGEGDTKMIGRVRALTPEAIKRITALSESQDIATALSFSGIFPSQDDETQPEFTVYMQPYGQIATEAWKTAQGIDSQVFFGHPDVTCKPEDFPKSVREFQGTLAATPNNSEGIARLLYQYFGEEVIDLAFALYLYSDMHEDHEKMGKYSEAGGVALTKFPRDKKIDFFEQSFGNKPLDPATEIKILNIALGDKFMARLEKTVKEETGSDVASTVEMVAKLKELIETKSNLRRKLLRACMSLPMVSDKIMADVFMRMGWPTFMGTKSLQDRDFWLTLKGDVEAISQDPETLARYQARPDFRAQVAAMEKYFAEHPDEAAEDDIQERVMDLVDCKRHRTELQREKSKMNTVPVRHKQMEIVHAVCREAFKLKFVRREEGDSKIFEQGFPANAAETGDLSCFSGPWLIAMLLLNSGFEYEDISYCHINQAHNGFIGGHGGLVVKLADNQLVFIDYGFHTVAPLRVELIGGGDKDNTMKAIEFFRDGGMGSIHTQMDPMMAKMYQIHPDMQVMDLTSGFGSGHMLHVGIKLLDEGDIEAAEYALQMALSFHKEDPDALYYLGLIGYRTGDHTEAKAYCEECTQVFPNYLAAHFLLGQIAEAEGNQEEAITKYKIVVETEGIVFGDDKFRKTAEERLTTFGEAFRKPESQKA